MILILGGILQEELRVGGSSPPIPWSSSLAPTDWLTSSFVLYFGRGSHEAGLRAHDGRDVRMMVLRGPCCHDLQDVRYFGGASGQPLAIMHAWRHSNVMPIAFFSNLQYCACLCHETVRRVCHLIKSLAPVMTWTAAMLSR